MACKDNYYAKRILNGDFYVLDNFGNSRATEILDIVAESDAETARDATQYWECHHNKAMWASYFNESIDTSDEISEEKRFNIMY